NLEAGRAKEAEAVGLVHVLVRAARDAGLGHRDVRHRREELGRDLVTSEQLAQPAAGVAVLDQRSPDGAVDGARVKLHVVNLLWGIPPPPSWRPWRAAPPRPPGAAGRRRGRPGAAPRCNSRAAASAEASRP